LYDGAQHPQYKREGHERITGQGNHDKSGDRLRRFPTPVEPEGGQSRNPRGWRVDDGCLFLWDRLQPSDRSAEAKTAADVEYREPESPRRYGEHPTSRAERLARR
jgi:hypothetical protein